MMDISEKLRHSAIYGNMQEVEDLLQQGADPNEENQHKNTSLHLAAYYGHAGVVNELIQRKTRCTIVNTNGQTPLQLAAVKGHLAIVEMLTQVDCSIDNHTQVSGMTALHYASKGGHAKVCQHLLDRGASEEILDSIGKTAEHYAANRETELVFKKRRASSAERTQRQEPEQQEIVVSPANQRQGKIAADKTTTGSEKSGTEQEVGKINGEEDAEGDSPEVDHKDKRGKGHKKWKRVKDHKFEWSDDFKARQKQTVFDRLMGGGKK